MPLRKHVSRTADLPGLITLSMLDGYPTACMRPGHMIDGSYSGEATPIVLTMAGQVYRGDALLSIEADAFVSERNLAGPLGKVLSAAKGSFQVRGPFDVTVDTDSDPAGRLVISATVEGTPDEVAEARWQYSREVAGSLGVLALHFALLLDVR